MTRLTATYGTRRIEFILLRRSVRSLAITVMPDGAVKVAAPLEADEARIIARVATRGSWIVKQWDRQALWLPAKSQPEILSGESVRYLGRQYRVRLRTDPGADGVTVGMTRAVLEVRAPAPLPGGEAGKAVAAWLRRRAGEVLPGRFNQCLKVAELHGLSGGRISLRRMPKRWGSCVKSGPILLNPELIRLPVDCIDYVILHELCHRKVHSHGPAFYRLLTAVLPDWQKRRARLARIQ